MFFQDSQLGDYAKIERIDSIVDKSKKMAANLEHALRKFIESTPKKAVDRCSHGKHGEVDNDFNNYEQLVIMKKYPFLDLQELNFNVRQLASKNSGQNLNSEQVLIAQDPSFCESSNEGPSVEITNRGLSGFALPAKLPKPETKEKPADVRYERTSAKSLSDYLNLIKSLEDDIKSFEVHHIR